MGTLVLSLLFSAYIVWTIYMTTPTDEEMKDYGYTHKGKLMGMKFYSTLPDVEGIMMTAGGNLITDQFIPVLIELGANMNGGELKINLEEIK